MTGSYREILWVLMPPELEYLPGLFLPDRFRARIAARLALALPRWNAQGMTVHLDPGASGYTAMQTAQRLHRRGAKRAVVAGGPFDGAAARLLCRALGAAGIHCAPPFLSRGDGADLFPALLKRMKHLIGNESLAREGAAGPGSPAEGKESSASGRASSASEHPPEPAYMILSKGERLNQGGIAFREREGGLERVDAGRVLSLPSWVRAVRYATPDGAVAPGIRGGEIDVVHALLLPGSGEPEPGDRDRWLEACTRLIETVGTDRFRLDFADGPPKPAGRSGGAPWSARYRLHRPVVRDFLTALVTKHLPDRLGWLQTVMGFYRMGIDPLEEMYGDNALPDRNAALIEVIAP